MDSENGRMTREEYRAQMGLDAEPNAKREKSGDAGHVLYCSSSLSAPPPSV